MPRINRRHVLRGTAASAAAWLSGCGGGTAESTLTEATDLNAATDAAVGDQTAQAPARRPTVTTPTLPAGKYRCTQPYLFQPIPAKTIPSRLPGGTNWPMDNFGPTYLCVDMHTEWFWDRPGGDWLDAAGMRHGSTPWFSHPVGAVSGATAIQRYSMDVTAAIRFCQTNNRWCALLVTAINAPRAIAGMAHPSEPAPFLMVTYVGGTQARLNCRLLGVNSKSSNGPATLTTSTPLPVFVEFDRPVGAVASATMHVSLTEHWSGNDPRLVGFVLDPPVNKQPARAGLAAGTGRLDQGLPAVADIIGVHRYLDGSRMSDFALLPSVNFGAERNYDPAIFGTGARDTTKLPHLGLGKWVGVTSNWTLVNSSHVGDGFAPLAPGLGAMRLQMPAEPGVTDGSVVGYSGTLAGNGQIFLPEALFGRLPRIFVRYYLRVGTPALATRADRKHVYHQPGYPVWTTCAGKFGIAPDHSTATGGVSGSAGGGHGWQMRHAWYDCDAEKGGPDEGGWAAGYHLYDFYYRNPPGHNYGRGDRSEEGERWGQIGGLGGVMYAGQWYCVETELKLNSLTSDAPGFLADGELRTWIDGRLTFQRTGMVFRTAPIADLAYNPEQVRPCRELGVRGLWLDWFHGGKTVNTINRTMFFTGLAWAKQYIGPMTL